MKIVNQIFGVLFFLISLSAHAVLPVADSQGQPIPTLAPMLKKITPAVVNISTYTEHRVYNPLLQDPFFRRFFSIPNQPQHRTTQSAGSGVIIDSNKGYVVTNFHVIENTTAIKVTLNDGREFPAELVGGDKQTDLALLKIEPDNLAELPLANSKVMEVGDFVIAIGNPFGLGQTVTTGVVSALGRSGLGMEQVQNFIQTDASINPGNSGGALVNLRGELIGINTAIIAPSGGNVGIGFAIPSNMAKTVVSHLQKEGKLERGLLGIVMQDLTNDLAEAFGMSPTDGGVLITQVLPESAAEKADLQEGDIVLSINGETVRQASQLRSQLGILAIGDSVKLSINRNGKSLVINTAMAELAEMKSDGGEYHPKLKGLILKSSPDRKGIEIIDVERRSRGAYVGLEPGDIIVSINRQPVEDFADLKRITAAQERLLLLLNRGGQGLYVSVRL